MENRTSDNSNNKKGGSKPWDTIVDVVVVGSGAGALTASLRAHDLGLKTLVLEKTDQYGGTSAISGGGIWIPNSFQMQSMGIKDSDKVAVDYIKRVIGEEPGDGRIEAYVANAKKMLRYLEESTRVRFESQSAYADYYPELPGGMPGYRSMDPLPFHASKLGSEFENLRPTSPATLMLGRMAMTMKEARVLLCRGKGFLLTNMKIMGRYYKDIFWRLKSKRDRYLTLGNALVAALRASMLDRDISLWLNSPMESLIEENGQVIGVVINRGGKPLRVKARKGVIIGAGGFESNQAMRDQYHPQPSQALWSAAPEGINTGDGIQAGQNLGAATALMEHSWWAPTSHVEGETRSRAMFVERALPNCILVNKAGKRFMNEAAPYNDFGDGMYGTGSVPCWFVFDAQYRHKYPCGALLPGYAVPDKAVPKRYKNCFRKAESLEALAETIGVDASGLKETVANYNQYSVEGKDPEFGKGDSLFDRYYGDPNTTPNPCLGPLEKGPFYAVKVNIGDIGTKGGLVTNVDGQVLKEDGSPITGLYAIGNTSASVMKQTYPGAGSTIGPAMTFGYLSANHIAQRQVDARTVKAGDAVAQNPEENKNAVEA